MIENFTPADQNTRAPYTQVKKIDIGNCYLIFVSGTQAPVGEDKVVVTHQNKKVLENLSRANIARTSLRNPDITRKLHDKYKR